MKRTRLFTLPLALSFALVACRERPSTPTTGEDLGNQFAVRDDTPATIGALPQGGICSLENILTRTNNASNAGDAPNTWKVRRGQGYRIFGFATNKDAGLVPTTITVALVGSKVYELDANTGSQRPDVAQAFNVPVFAQSGYQVDASFDRVEPGSYQAIVLYKDGERRIACPTGQTITVQ